jgi:hypothetical protein
LDSKRKVKEYMHLPLEMVNRIMSSSTYNFNEFKTYLSFAFHTSGNCKLNTEIKNQVSSHLGISQRTVNKHIKSLIDKQYFGYNYKTNTLFINGLKKIKHIVYLNENFDKHIKSKTSFILNVSNFNELKFLTFTATEKLILKYQSSYKKKLKLKNYLVSNNLFKRYEDGSKSEQKRLRKTYQNDTKGDSMTKENPNRLVINDNDYLGVSNSFISNRFNRTKSWGSKMKKKSFGLSLLNYNKKSTFIQSFPLTFNVRKYLSINYPEKYNRFFLRRDDNSINVYETLYDEIIPNISLTTRRSK